jgi:ABC-2 type transport system permease protein
MDRIWTVIQKEITEALRNRMTMATIIISTLVFMLLPLVMAYGTGSNGLLQKISNEPIDTSELGPILQVYPQLRDLDPAAQLQGFLLSGIQALFLIIPLMIPMIIAVYSVIGEKQNRSLEAVLATPIETSELLIAKCVSAAVPGILSAWVSYTLFAILVWPATRGPVFDVIIMRPGWLLALLLVAPAAAFLAVIIGLIVSSRASDPQSAQQIAGVIVLPVVAVMIGQMAGIVQLSVLFVLLGALVLLAIDAGLLTVAVKLFQRETILTRWK